MAIKVQSFRVREAKIVEHEEEGGGVKFLGTFFLTKNFSLLYLNYLTRLKNDFGIKLLLLQAYKVFDFLTQKA